MSDFDPTTNRVPFGLLTPKEQTALTEWSHGWEYHRHWSDDWVPAPLPAWAMQAVYRGKPAPVVIKRFAAIYPYAQLGSWRDNIHDVMKAGGADMIGIIQLDIKDNVPSTKIIEVKK